MESQELLIIQYWEYWLKWISYLLTGEGEKNDSLAVYIRLIWRSIHVWLYSYLFFVRLLECVCKRIAIKYLWNPKSGKIVYCKLGFIVSSMLPSSAIDQKLLKLACGYTFRFSDQGRSFRALSKDS